MQVLSLQLKGLFTHPNPLSEVPPGALLRAKNMVMDKEGIIETRRGFKRYGTALTLAAGQKINSILNYQSTLLVHYASKLARDSDGAGTWSDYSGSYSAPSGAVSIRSLEANKNFYFTTSTGVYKLDSVSGTPGAAGMYKGLDGTPTVLATASGFLSNNNQVAYRIVWGIKDANGNLVLGAPSQRFIAINSSGSAQDVSLAFSIPSGITTSHFYQIYRSLMSGGVTTVPNDELGLVYELAPTAGQIIAKSVTVTDSVPEALRGTTIYTAPSQQGISQANDIPPLCQDMAFYKNVTLYANTTSKQRLILTVISVAGAIGIAINDTVTIAGVVYTAKGAETASSGEFKVTTSGTPAENIDATAQSLVRVINQYASNTTVYAYYLSGYNDLPGKILIEERSIGGAAFVAIGSNGAAFNPALPTSGTTISSTNDQAKHRVYISKNQQPEAVPLLNYLDIGSANKNILRIIALRDSIFVFKEDGVFRITGEDISSFKVSLFDVTVILTARETAVPFNNQIYAYTSQGVVGISDTGSAILSRPIEVDLLSVSTYTNFATYSFGVAYNSDRKYILAIQSSSTDTYPTQEYIYNSLSNAWTRWAKNWTCGIVNSADEKLYFGAADSAYIYQERKTLLRGDYADDELNITISSSSGTTITVTDTTGVLVGWSVSQGSRISSVTAVVDGTTLTVADSGLAWTAGAAVAYSPISAEVETVPLAAMNPGVLKHYRHLIVFFRKADFASINIGVRSDLSAYIESQSCTPIQETKWGGFAWGSYGWGSNPDVRAVPTFVARNKQRCHWLSVNISHSTAKDYFAVAGVSLQYQPMSEKSK